MTRRRALAALVGALLAVASVVGLASPAAAVTIDPCGSLTPPVPSVPGRGSLTDFFLPNPDPVPPPADPWAPNSGTTIYEQYGLAAFEFRTWDMGCNPVNIGLRTWNNDIANFFYAVPKFGIGATGGLLNVAYTPTDWTPVVDRFTAVANSGLWQTITKPVSIFVMTLLGILLLAQARRSRWGYVAGVVLFGVGALAIAAATVQYPQRVGSAADEALTQGAQAIYTAVNRNTNSDAPPDVAAVSAVTDTIMYNRWLQGSLGSTTSPVARDLGPVLFDAQALTWSEWERGQDDPEALAEIIERKNQQWIDAAAEVKERDPDAYRFLTGDRKDRVVDAFMAGVAVLASLPFLAAGALVMIGAFLVIRLVVVFLPGLVGFAWLPATQPIVKGAGTAALAALVNSLLFASGVAVTVAALSVLSAPDNGLPQFVSLVLMAVLSAIMWKLLKPFRRLTTMVSARSQAGLMQDVAGYGAEQGRSAWRTVKRQAVNLAGAYVGGRVAGAAAASAIDAAEQQREQAARPETETTTTGGSETVSPTSVTPTPPALPAPPPTTETGAEPPTPRTPPMTPVEPTVESGTPVYTIYTPGDGERA